MCIVSVLLSGCTSLGAGGPTTGSVRGAAKKDGPEKVDIKVVDLTDTVARRAVAEQSGSFADVLGEGLPVGTIIGRGDVLDIAIWEAPPAALFGSVGGTGSPAASAAVSIRTTQSVSLPQQMVDNNGDITIPFVGSVSAAGSTPKQVEQRIVARLAGKAHLPQVIVSLVKNASANVTVVGDVVASARVPLTPKGERLLDVLASVGGTKQPVGKTTIQITRGKQVLSQPLDKVIRDPRQNIRMESDDVVTALYQPYSFTALGAIANNAEINFEGNGITLAQALGRVGGLQDSRADIRGVFLFRFENPEILGSAIAVGAPTTQDGKIPVIYRLDLRNPASFFLAQDFPMKDRDVLYVSNAPGVDLQKFISLVSSVTFSVIGLGNQLK
jgi:polysaccharide export outer membrane protein